MSKVDSKIDASISSSVSKSIGGLGRRIEVPAGGGGGVDLSALQSIISSFNNGIGFLRDFRINDGLAQDAGNTTPVVASGDPIGYAQNQSGMPGADATACTETTTSSKPLWFDKKGIQDGGGTDELNDLPFIDIGCTAGETTLVIAAKILPFGTNVMRGAIRANGNDFNLMFYDFSASQLRTRAYIGGPAANFNFTADANDVAVIMARKDSSTDNCLVYCNNVFLGSFGVSTSNWAAPISIYLNSFTALSGDQHFLGAAAVPGLMDETQRQVFCDHFQNNGGFLP